MNLNVFPQSFVKHDPELIENEPVAYDQGWPSFGSPLSLLT